MPNTALHDRKPNRLQEYDYSQNGYYSITVCTQGRREWFGNIENDTIKLNEYGKIVMECWHDLPAHYMNIKLDVFTVMPNHVHGIIVIVGNGLKQRMCVGNGLKPFPTIKMHGLSEIIRGFKTFSSRRINEKIKNRQNFRWQKSFYDHIIRNELSLNRIREYIVHNPQQWATDIENIHVNPSKSNQ
jgi:putative transposase